MHLNRFFLFQSVLKWIRVVFVFVAAFSTANVITISLCIWYDVHAHSHNLVCFEWSLTMQHERQQQQQRRTAAAMSRKRDTYSRLKIEALICFYLFICYCLDVNCGRNGNCAHSFTATENIHTIFFPYLYSQIKCHTMEQLETNKIKWPGNEFK